MWVSVGIIPGPDIGELQSLPVKPMLQEHPPRLLHICKYTASSTTYVQLAFKAQVFYLTIAVSHAVMFSRRGCLYKVYRYMLQQSQTPTTYYNRESG